MIYVTNEANLFSLVIILHEFISFENKIHIIRKRKKKSWFKYDTFSPTNVQLLLRFSIEGLFTDKLVAHFFDYLDTSSFAIAAKFPAG